MTAVDSWSHCENVCRQALAERQILENNGWTISLDNNESSGIDYIFDSISVMELPPAFPNNRSNVGITYKVGN